LANFYPILSPVWPWAYTLDPNIPIKPVTPRLTHTPICFPIPVPPTPLDVWTPSRSLFVKAALLDQYALVFQELKNGDFHWRQSFIRIIQKSHRLYRWCQLIANDAIDAGNLNGEARAYGFEFPLRKNHGEFQVGLAYSPIKIGTKLPAKIYSEPGLIQEMVYTPTIHLMIFPYIANYKLK